MKPKERFSKEVIRELLNIYIPDISNLESLCVCLPYLIKESKPYLQEFAKSKIEEKDDLLNAVQFETVYTARAIIAHNGRTDIDIIDFLRQVKYVFGNERNINIILDFGESLVSEGYTIPVGNTKKYLDAIEKIVTNVKSHP